ncbi:BTB/POZ domain protein [Klosneuvirus KNV1]|uniref:BTB/POZ domain protein n=1 Tax=Klosneuvirus KNV1 TaxID=1977640 RepID=A0A1V0SLT1_9VIRU|nr:BTB/POZ domain protein [Klosneuvirus KNV1]
METVKLNVGGVHFQTTKDTLIKSPYFSMMLNGKWSIPKDEIFIDRSGKIFEHILNLLRDPTYSYPEKYLSELDFYLMEQPENMRLCITQTHINDIKYLLDKTDKCKEDGCYREVQTKLTDYCRKHYDKPKNTFFK